MYMGGMVPAGPQEAPLYIIVGVQNQTLLESQFVIFPTGFSVDFSRSVFPNSSLFGFSLKKLPLEALGSSALTIMQS